MNRPVGRLFRRLTNATAVLGFLAVGYAADDQAPSTSQPTATSAEVQDLKRQLAEQQKQIEELRLILLGQKKQIDTVSNAAAAPAETRPRPRQRPWSRKSERSRAPHRWSRPRPAPAPVPFTPPAATPAPARRAADTDSPLQLKIGGATITPIGFMDLDQHVAQHQCRNSLQTNFGRIPYNTA